MIFILTSDQSKFGMTVFHVASFDDEKNEILKLLIQRATNEKINLVIPFVCALLVIHILHVLKLLFRQQHH